MEHMIGQLLDLFPLLDFRIPGKGIVESLIILATVIFTFRSKK